MDKYIAKIPSFLMKILFEISSKLCNTIITL